MLDTKTYAVFAVSKGEVVLNKLLRIDVDPMSKLVAGNRMLHRLWLCHYPIKTSENGMCSGQNPLMWFWLALF